MTYYLSHTPYTPYTHDNDMKNEKVNTISKRTNLFTIGCGVGTLSDEVYEKETHSAHCQP